MKNIFQQSPFIELAGHRDFEKEESRSLDSIKRMHDRAVAFASKDSHPFFGKMTPLKLAHLPANHLNPPFSLVRNV